jgi:hypothetical protein
MKLGRHSNFPCGRRSCGPTAKLQRVQRAEPPPWAASGPRRRGAVLAWTALLVAIVVSFRPAVPVIWGDTPSFVESALLTLEAGRPTVAGGRDPGYPAFLAVTFGFGGGLGTVVRLQQAAWVKDGWRDFGAILFRGGPSFCGPGLQPAALLRAYF